MTVSLKFLRFGMEIVETNLAGGFGGVPALVDVNERRHWIQREKLYGKMTLSSVFEKWPRG